MDIWTPSLPPGIVVQRQIRFIPLTLLGYSMNEDEAILKARRFLEGRKLSPVHWDQAIAMLRTMDSTRKALEKENFGERDSALKAFIIESSRRSCWWVSFPFVIPDGVVQSPDSICVRIYDDTGECEIQLQL